MTSGASSAASAASAPPSDGALRFFDPELARFDRGVDLVRILLDPRSDAEPISVAAADETILFNRLAYHRLLPQLRVALDDARIEPETERLQLHVQRASTMQMLRGLQLERLLIDVGGRFDAHGIEFRVLKGTATGHLDHLQPGLRQSADIDLLLPDTTTFRSATEQLRSLGLSSPDAAVRLMDKGETWRLDEDLAVDLHVRLHTAGRPLPREWWTRSETFQIAGHEFSALDRSGRLAHAASHLALSYPNHRILSSLLDLLLLSRAASSRERMDSTRLLHALGVSDVVRRITQRAAVLIGDDTIVVGAPGHRPLDWFLRRAYDRPDLDKVALKVAKTFGMPWDERLRVFRNWVAPSEEFLETGGYRSPVDRVTSIVRRRIRPSDPSAH